MGCKALLGKNVEFSRLRVQGFRVMGFGASIMKGLQIAAICLFSCLAMLLKNSLGSQIIAALIIATGSWSNFIRNPQNSIGNYQAPNIMRADEVCRPHFG